MALMVSGSSQLIRPRPTCPPHLSEEIESDFPQLGANSLDEIGKMPIMRRVHMCHRSYKCMNWCLIF